MAWWNRWRRKTGHEGRAGSSPDRSGDGQVDGVSPEVEHGQATGLSYKGHRGQADSFSYKALDDRRDLALSSGRAGVERIDAERQELFTQALAAWRSNPLARRIVALTSQYVVGGGVAVHCAHPETDAFLEAFWGHRLNRMSARLIEWCDELTRSGNLFVLVSTDAAGMSYVRALPALQVQAIESAENDIEQAQWIVEKPRLGDPGLEARRWAVYQEADDRREADGSFATAALHYAVNRPAGAAWGEPDLAPLLKWLNRYAAWLEDRARLNRYRNTFLFWVKAQFSGPAERLQRQAELNANPPSPGSILVTDSSEEWSTLNSNLASFEAGEDGIALKKMIAAGSGTPLHFLAEPESATRTTAEAAGGPTFRHYEQRQLLFTGMIRDLLGVVVRRRAMVDRRVTAQADIRVEGADISSRDNVALASAAATAIAGLGGLHREGLIDAREYLRLVYRFAGEAADVEDLLRRGAIEKGKETGE